MFSDSFFFLINLKNYTSCRWYYLLNHLLYVIKIMGKVFIKYYAFSWPAVVIRLTDHELPSKHPLGPGGALHPTSNKNKLDYENDEQHLRKSSGVNNVRLFEHLKKEAVSQRVGQPSDGLSFHIPGRLSLQTPFWRAGSIYGSLPNLCTLSQWVFPGGICKDLFWSRCQWFSTLAKQWNHLEANELQGGYEDYETSLSDANV